MVFIGSNIKIIDNSGIKNLKIIQFLKTNCHSKLVSKFVLATIKILNTKSKLKKKDIYTCLIVTTKT
jgi:ribosomal protein L14